MTMHTDCRARRVRTDGCGCAYCTDNAILQDGETSRRPMLFLDATQQQVKAHFDGGQLVADGWPKRVFDAAGVAVRPDDALHAERGVAEEREKARELAAEQRQQGRTANRQAQETDGAWDNALAKLNSGGIRSARFDRV